MTKTEQSQGDRSDLDELRAELARFVLREAGEAVVADPSLPLSTALTRAIHEEAERAARLAQEAQPTPDVLAASVVQAVQPELIQIVRAAARGDTAALELRHLKGWIASTPVSLIIMTAMVGLLAAFAIGFGAAWMLVPNSGLSGGSPASQAAPTPVVPGAAEPVVDPTMPIQDGVPSSPDLLIEDPAP